MFTSLVAPNCPHHIFHGAQKAVHQGDSRDRGYSRDHRVAGACEGMKELIQVDRWNATAVNLLMLGSGDDIPRIAEGRHVDEMTIAMPSVGGQVIRDVVARGRQLGAKIQALPGMCKIADGKIRLKKLRDIEI